MIESSNNKQIKKIKQLQKKSKARDEYREFVIEGIKMYGEIPEDKIVATYISESFFKEKFELYKNIIRDYEIVKDDIFLEICETMTPQGIIAVVKQPEYSLDDILDKDTSKIIILDDLRDPGNLGTIMRTAEGAGFDAVILSKSSVDMFNPKVVRSTMGAIYRVPFVYEDDLKCAINDTYKKAGFVVYSAYLDGAVDYTRTEYSDKTAIIIGNEANGISDEVIGVSDVLIKIPMSGQVESLNAAVSAAVIMYEVRRQTITIRITSPNRS